MWTTDRSKTSKAPYGWYNDQWVSYDDVTSIAEKVRPYFWNNCRTKFVLCNVENFAFKKKLQSKQNIDLESIRPKQCIHMQNLLQSYMLNTMFKRRVLL